VPENIDAWWGRRQWSKGVSVPYPVGTFRDEWSSYPVLKRQFHPELNSGITLTQVPPAADVYLTWQCETGHVFVATPAEQRSRPGTTRRRSVWCPDCTAGAVPGRPPRTPLPSPTPPLRSAHTAHTASEPSPAPLGPEPSADVGTTAPAASAAGTGGTGSTGSTGSAGRAGRAAGEGRARPGSRPSGRSTPRRVAAASPQHARSVGGDGSEPRRREPGEAFWSARAPRPASAAEAELRARIGERLEVDLGLNAVTVRRPFFDRLEVWPDFVIDELRVAIEYDTPGRFGLEHLGSRLDTDRRKDRLLRAVGWEVVRIRCGDLPLLGPHDIAAAGVSSRLVERLVEVLRSIRGDLFVDAYLRPPARRA
jgi:hypothetical protein